MPLLTAAAVYAAGVYAVGARTAVRVRLRPALTRDQYLRADQSTAKPT